MPCFRCANECHSERHRCAGQAPCSRTLAPALRTEDTGTRSPRDDHVSFCDRGRHTMRHAPRGPGRGPLAGSGAHHALIGPGRRLDLLVFTQSCSTRTWASAWHHARLLGVRGVHRLERHLVVVRKRYRSPTPPRCWRLGGAGHGFRASSRAMPSSGLSHRRQQLSTIAAPSNSDAMSSSLIQEL
jgi:hypothetical protein